MLVHIILFALFSVSVLGQHVPCPSPTLEGGAQTCGERCAARDCLIGCRCAEPSVQVVPDSVRFVEEAARLLPGDVASRDSFPVKRYPSSVKDTAPPTPTPTAYVATPLPPQAPTSQSDGAPTVTSSGEPCNTDPATGTPLFLDKCGVCGGKNINKCPTNNSGNTLIIVGGLAGGGVLLLAFAAYCRRQRKREKAEDAAIGNMMAAVLAPQGQGQTPGQPAQAAAPQGTMMASPQVAQVQAVGYGGYGVQGYGDTRASWGAQGDGTAGGTVSGYGGDGGYGGGQQMAGYGDGGYSAQHAQAAGYGGSFNGNSMSSYPQSGYSGGGYS